VSLKAGTHTLLNSINSNSILHSFRTHTKKPWASDRISQRALALAT